MFHNRKWCHFLNYLHLIPLSLLFRPFSERERNTAIEILGEDTWAVDDVYENETATFDEDLFLEYLEDVIKPYLISHGGGEGKNKKRAAFFLDIATHHVTPAVYLWLKKHNVDKYLIPASLTYKLQMVDVSLAAQYKNHLYTLWCTWMLKQIEENKFRIPSLNYIAPSKGKCIEWCSIAWNMISNENIKNGCTRCYMSPTNLDDAVSKYENVDLESIDWSKEIV